jgi:proteasome lid subunit RPN8/RPN11
MTRPVVRLSEDLRRRIVDHCLTEAPNEGCGLLAMDGDEVTEVYPTGNLDASPVGYTIPPEEHFAALSDAESRGWSLGGVFHSLSTGGPRPSIIDAQRALDPEWHYLVVGLRDEPEVRAWSIRDGRIDEVQLG